MQVNNMVICITQRRSGAVKASEDNLLQRACAWGNKNSQIKSFWSHRNSLYLIRSRCGDFALIIQHIPLPERWVWITSQMNQVKKCKIIILERKNVYLLICYHDCGNRIVNSNFLLRSLKKIAKTVFLFIKVLRYPFTKRRKGACFHKTLSDLIVSPCLKVCILISKLDENK